jgi:hypothetical protein
MNSNKVATVLFAAAGAGCGAIAAKLLGVASWPEAKMHIIVGMFLGVVLARALPHRDKADPSQ